VCRDVLFEYGPHGRQVEAPSAEMWMRLLDLYRQRALCGADINERVVPAPRKFLRDRTRRAETDTAHRTQEAAQRRFVVIDRLEQIAASLRFVLWQASAQRLR
jgi:hypothetical protein